MIDHAKNLRQTRASMIGTQDEEHYEQCHKAADALEQMQFACRHNADYIKELDDARKQGAKRIEELESGSCRFHCRTIKEAFIAGFDAGQIECEGGRIICLDLYDEVTDRKFKEWRDARLGSSTSE